MTNLNGRLKKLEIATTPTWESSLPPGLSPAEAIAWGRQIVDHLRTVGRLAADAGLDETWAEFDKFIRGLADYGK